MWKSASKPLQKREKRVENSVDKMTDFVELSTESTVREKQEKLSTRNPQVIHRKIRVMH